MATYFITDAHLGAKYIRDPKAHEAKVCAMLESFKPDASAIYMLGDMVDFWFEYRHVVPRGYVRFFDTLRRLTSDGIAVYWLHGNHDMWTGRYFEEELGVHVIPDTYYNIKADGVNIVATHGDTMGRVPWTYRGLRTLFRSTLCRRLLSMIHPALTMRVALGWSANSRKKEPAKIKLDLIGLTNWAAEYLHNHPTLPPTRYIVSGHMHVDERVAIPNTEAELIILGDSYRRFAYGILRGENFEIKHFESAQ